MARETKEEKEARREAMRLAEEQRLKEFREGLPKRLFEMQAIAQTVGIRTELELTQSGPRVTFHQTRTARDSSGPYEFSYSESLSYESDPWEVETVETWINDTKREYDARQKRIQIAKDLFSTLSDEEKLAIKENTYLLG